MLVGYGSSAHALRRQEGSSRAAGGRQDGVRVSAYARPGVLAPCEAHVGRGRAKAPWQGGEGAEGGAESAGRRAGRAGRPAATCLVLPSIWRARRRSRPPAHVRGGDGGVGEAEAESRELRAESCGCVRLIERCSVAAVARLHVEVLLAGGGDRIRLALVDQGGPLTNQLRFLRSVRARGQNLHRCRSVPVSVGHHDPCMALTACGVRGPWRARACFWSAPSLAVRTCCWHSGLFSRSALHQKANMSCVESSALERGARGVRPPSERVGDCA